MNPYRQVAEVPTYPKLNPITMEAPSYRRTYGCRCCSFGEPVYSGYRAPYLYSNNSPVGPALPYAGNDRDWSERVDKVIEYAWCVNCLLHYKQILNTFDFYCGLRTGLNYANEENYQAGRMVWFISAYDISILEYVVHNYHIPLIRYPRQWQEPWQAPLLTKTFPSKVSFIIMKLKRMLALK